MSHSRRVHLWVLLGLVCLVCSPRAQAAPLRVVTLDETGATFPDVLVIVRSLERSREDFRALTDLNGAVPPHDLSTGLYQLIATCPYGLCRTTVREFIVSTGPIDLKLPLRVLPTAGNAVILGGVEHRQVEVRDRNGKPVASAQILVRDAEAEYQKWYQTRADGKIVIDLAPIRETTIIVVYRGILATRVLKPDGSNPKDEPVLFEL